MKQVLVISGKGGTGKTTLVAGFASLAENAVIADCDVDAPDLHIILQPRIQREIPFYALKAPVKDESRCVECGRCRDVCRFNAIDEGFNIIDLRCEGCGACAFICPTDAIEMIDREAGRIYISRTRFGPFVHAQLKIGEEASGKLVTEVKRKAKELAEREKRELILIDGSPGIGCPVIASLSGVDLALIVTEPTVSGIHDLERILGVAEHFKIKTSVCINKFDINEEKTNEIETFCNENGIHLLGKIPYDSSITRAMIELKTAIEFSSSQTSERVKKIWSEIIKR
ncbi:MAG: (4Fe-4S)-binding protein [Candidatus Altiarchaeales archaeon]|nr:MAG: (4Fe-4S)-binding protein [Candidatus Altiarchaeales archaeon]